MRSSRLAVSAFRVAVSLAIYDFSDVGLENLDLVGRMCPAGAILDQHDLDKEQRREYQAAYALWFELLEKRSV